MKTAESKKRVLFIGGNYYPEPTGIGKFNGEMIDHLAGNGFQCTVITSFPYYPFWKVQQPYTRSAYWYKHEEKKVSSSLEDRIKIYRCPQYVPRDPSGLKRMLLDMSFCLSSLIRVFGLLFGKRYDYILTVVPGFPAGILGAFYKRFKGGKFIYHIQDLQIDAASELNIIKSKIALSFLLVVEKYLLKNADVVSSISTGMIRKIRSKYDRDIILFPNWVDTKTFHPLPDKVNLKREFGFKPTDQVILYSGAIGEKQGLEIILDVAPYFNNNPNVKFVICGTGPYKESLQDKALKKKLTNLIFLPVQPKEKLNYLLNLADAHLVLQKQNATDLVMPSKLTNILAVGGVAIVSASPGSTLHDLIATYSMGVLAEPDNMQTLIKAINHVLLSDNELIQKNARKYAECHLSINEVIADYLKKIQ